MSLPLRKKIPLRLSAPEYQALRYQVLHRDGWKCQNCGSLKNLEVHHQRYRGHSGEDTRDNLITLCAKCHKSHHS